MVEIFIKLNLSDKIYNMETSDHDSEFVLCVDKLDKIVINNLYITD